MKKIASDFKAFYQTKAAEKTGHHDVDHSTGSYIYDTKGHLRLYVTNENGADVFAHDIAELLKVG